MGNITTAIASAFRDFVTDGVAASGVHEPVKSDVRALGPLIEAAIGAAGLGALVGVTKTTKALLEADLAHAAETVALVYADATDANNDLYVKTGASGAGSWTNTGALNLIVEGLFAPHVDAAADSADAAAASAAAAANTVAKPIWAGKLNGWPDPFFRAFDQTAATFLGRERWYQSFGPFGPGWTKVKNAVFDGFALRRTAGYNQTTRSGPTIWLDELGAVPGDTITLYVLVIDPAAAGGTVYCQYQFSQDSPFAAIGGPVLMQNAAGTLAGVVADATPKFMRAEAVVPADATRVQLIPYNFSGATGFDLIAVWAFKGGIATGPAWPTLPDNYFGLRDAEIINPTPDLRAWLRAEAYTVTSTITYNAFGRPVSPLNIVWPDGKTGVLTITYNTDGTVASLSATYAGAPARTVSQPTITYARGVPTNVPAITVS